MAVTKLEAPGNRVLLSVRAFPQVSETFIFNLLVGMLDRGWDMHIQASREIGEAWRAYAHHPRRTALAERLHYKALTPSLIAALKPDIVHAAFGWLAPVALPHVVDEDLAFIVSLRGSDIRVHELGTPGYYDDVWRRADMVHVVSEALWQDARARGCSEDVPHLRIPDAIDLSFFRRDSPVHVVGGVGTPTQPLRLLSIARLDWTKGLDYGLLAVRQVLDAGVTVQYTILGDGPAREEVEYAIADLRLGDAVMLAGSVDRVRVRSELVRAHIVLHPSVSEGLGVAVCEAQAMGVPVVCTNAGGLGEVVQTGITGVVVPGRDPAALATAVMSLAREPMRRQRMGVAAAQSAQERFSIERQLDETDAMYRAAIANRRGFSPVSAT
jgi:colanic acid/amylovoran biosynthesis glycosyltransferase